MVESRKLLERRGIKLSFLHEMSWKKKNNLALGMLRNFGQSHQPRAVKGCPIDTDVISILLL